MPKKLLLLLACWSTLAQALDYEVTLAAPSTLEPLLREHLDLFALRNDEALSEQDLANIVAGTEAEVKSLLETEGYFSPQVKVGRKGQQISVTVEAGVPVIVMDVDVNLQGPVRQQQDFSRFLSKVMEDWALPDGAVFRQSEWDASKRAALRPFLRDRFPQARITRSEVKIDPETRRAAIRLDVDSGPLLRFGALQIQGMSRYPQRLVSDMASFNAGDPYHQDKLLTLQAALEADPHFTGVVVAPLWENLQGDTVPVSVELTEQKRQKVELGLNFSTGQGPGFRLGYEHYNLLRQGYTGSFAYDWKKDKQQLDLGLGFARDNRGYSHSLNLQQKHDESGGTVLDTREIGLFRIRQQDNIESRLGIEWLQDREQLDSELQRDNGALVLSAGWARRAVESALRPQDGYLLEGNISGAVGGLASDTRFVRLYGRAAWYVSPSFMPGTWVGRLELGQVYAQNGQQVPASRLFKAGGVGSVRGYEDQALGVRDPVSGVISGGRVLATGSVEYQYPIRKDWRLAAFIDGGDAADSWRDWRMASAYGLGVRWLSPLAPLAFDLGYGDRDKRWRWNLNLGLAF